MGLGKWALSSALNSGAGIFDWLGRGASYTGNLLAKNLYPGIDQLMQLYHRDRLTHEQLRWFAQRYGADLEVAERPGIPEDVWRKVLMASEWDFGVEDAIRFRRLGYWSDRQTRACLTNNGVWRVEKQNLLLNDTELMDLDNAINAYRQGLITFGDLRTRAELDGLVDVDELRRLLQLSSTVGVTDALLLHFQGRIDAQALQQLLVRNGLTSDRDILLARQSAEQVPGGSDLVRFAVREVWDSNVVQRFGYDEGYDQIPEFTWWMKAQGYGGSPNPRNSPQNPYQLPPKPATFTGTDAQWAAANSVDSWARAYYRAHWDLPSPTQGYEFLHRLRPNRIARYQQLIPGVQPWTIDDLRLLLKTADYPAPFRDRLAAVSYRVITRVDLRRMYSTGVIDLAEVYEQNLDYGYNPTDARNLTTFIERDERNKKLATLRKKERARAERAYRAGWIDQQELTRKLTLTGLDATSAGLQARSIALDDAEGDDVLAVDTVRRLYRSWEIDEIAARNRLGRLGLVSTGIDRLMHRWTLEREQRSRRVTAGQIARWVVRGVLGPGSAAKRLEAMGYDAADALRIISVARQDHEILAARAAKSAATTVKQQQRAAAAEIRASQRQTELAQRRMARGGTPGNLVKWLKKGLIKRPEAFRRLLQLGWTQADAERHLEAAVPFVGNRPGLTQPTPPDLMEEGQ